MIEVDQMRSQKFKTILILLIGLLLVKQSIASQKSKIPWKTLSSAVFNTLRDVFSSMVSLQPIPSQLLPEKLQMVELPPLRFH